MTIQQEGSWSMQGAPTCWLEEVLRIEEMKGGTMVKAAGP
jgi:hypothetical protein